MTQQEENNKLMNSFLERTFFKGFRNPELKECENFRTVELFLNTKCNLSCKYCYLARYGNELYPLDFQEDKKILKNLEMLLDWMIKNKLIPYRLEYFAGEPLVQEMGLEGLEIILDKFKNVKRKPTCIVIPSNFTFLLSENLTKRIEKLLEKSRRLSLPIGISVSFDGKYCEANRPFKSKKELRDDNYYDKAFASAKKWGWGFHPMIYSELIENWEKNFLWFQENFQKHNIPWTNIYLLEVRNAEWQNEQILKFGKFIEFLIKWTFQERCHNNPGEFINFLFDNGYNILRNPLCTIGRGLGCSIQSTMNIRVGDLTWVPCHRTSYPPFTLAKFKVKKNKIVGLESNNSELMIGIYSFDAKNQPWCQSCLLKPLCSFGCLGSQLETNGDLFSPIPTVCQLEHFKIASMIKAYKDLKIFDLILNKVNPQKAKAFKKLEQIFEQPAKIDIDKKQD